MYWSYLEHLISKLLLKSRKNRIRIAIIIIIVYSVISAIFIPTIVGGYWDIVSSAKTHSFELPVHININGTRSFDIQLSFGLTFTYYNEILVSNEPIDISGVAVMDENVFNISRIQFGYQYNVF